MFISPSLLFIYKIISKDKGKTGRLKEARVTVRSQLLNRKSALGTHPMSSITCRASRKDAILGLRACKCRQALKAKLEG